MARDAVGMRLRHARKLRGLTQQELEEASGVAQAIISETETGESKSPSGPNLVALAQALRVNAPWLAHNKGPMEIPKPTTEQEKLSPEALAVARNWDRLAPEVGRKIADMILEMVKVSAADKDPARDEDVAAAYGKPGKRVRKT